MKNIYIEPEIEIMMIAQKDVICTSAKAEEGSPVGEEDIESIDD